MSWDDYNGNLVMYYGREPIPVTPEEDWKLTAESILSLATFANYAIPDPDLYQNWQDWARDFTQILNGPSY